MANDGDADLGQQWEGKEWALLIPMVAFVESCLESFLLRNKKGQDTSPCLISAIYSVRVQGAFAIWGFFIMVRKRQYIFFPYKYRMDTFVMNCARKYQGKQLT